MPDGSHRRRAVAAAVTGNLLEWYDFAVYAFLASTLAAKFFPGEDRAAGLLSAFLAYGLGFVARPLGGLFFGWLGDARGRRHALLFTIFLMAGGTVMIGLLPTYASIGVAAPGLLVIARLLQGFAAGGDWGCATAYIVEWAPRGGRGWYGSFQQMSVAGGLLLGSGVAALLNTVVAPAAMEMWGWRIPFLLGGLLGPVGHYMRRAVEETPAYLAAAAQPAGTLPPGALRLAGRAFGFTIVWTVSYYSLLNYMPTWAQDFMHLSAASALWANSLGLVVLLAAIPLMGRLSDRIGRKPLLLACCVGFIVVPYPVFRLLLAHGSTALWLLIVMQVFFALLIAMFSGPGPAAISEIFTTGHRSTLMTSGYSLAVASFGGFAPFISVWLIREFGSPTVHSFYLMAAAAVSTLVIARLPETAFEELR